MGEIFLTQILLGYTHFLRLNTQALQWRTKGLSVCSYILSFKKIVMLATLSFEMRGHLEGSKLLVL